LQKRELAEFTREQVRGIYRKEQVDISSLELDEISEVICELGGAHVAEIFSPPRYCKQASRLGLRAGFSVDLTENKPNGEKWDLCKDEDVRELEKVQKDEDPYFLIGSPPCEVFSSMWNIGKYNRDPRRNMEMLSRGRKHLRTSIEAYRRQMARGRYFVHEHPAGANSWKTPEAQEFSKDPRVFFVKGPMCRWDMQQEDMHGVGHIRKNTGWWTNSPVLAELLQGVCSNETGERPWHRHVALEPGTGRAHLARIHPAKLVSAVLKGIKMQMHADGELSAVEAQQSGPVPEDARHLEGVQFPEEMYWDTVNGGWLRSSAVLGARKLELDYVRRHNIYSKVPLQQSQERQGKPIPLGWVDTNKGDDEHPNYRSRLVVREFKGKYKGLSAAELFSSMPPLEALKALVSLMVSKKLSKRKQKLKLAVFDISRAHMYGVAQREVYVELPDGDKEEGMCGLLNRSLYGTQDASHIWQSDYVAHICSEEGGYRQGLSSTAVFWNEEQDALGMVHGDDFIILGDDEAATHMGALLKKRYECRRVGLLGPEEADDKEIVVLNRLIRYMPEDESVEIECDARHGEMVVNELGLTKAKEMSTPGVKQKVEDALADAELLPMGAADCTKFRSATMRCSYVAQDRPDIGVACKDLARHMQLPNEADLVKLKRLGRYLKGRPRAAFRFKRQPLAKELLVTVDSDHAGCPVTRKSTTGMVIRLGDHVVKSGSSIQSTIALNSGESEYYALVKGAAYGLSVQALLNDWGIEVSLNIESDSSAARSFSSRRGLGKQRHVQTRFLWIQERVALKHFKVSVVKTKDNVADVLTKHMSAPERDVHFKTMGIVFPTGRAEKQKRLLQ
jgi:hypothetical protein